MGIWILMVVFYFDGTPALSQPPAEFNSSEACVQAARAAMRMRQNKGTEVWAVCAPKAARHGEPIPFSTWDESLQSGDHK